MAMVSVRVDLKGIFREIDKINNVPVAAERAMRRYIDDDAEPAFLKTTETWKHTPVFNKSITASPSKIVGQIWTDDKVYHILDGGADPHPITPTKGKFLHFQTGFTPKTKPKWIGSQSGGKDTSSPWARRLSVKHPGIEAREFAKTIAEDTQPKIVAKFREELKRL